MNNKNVEITLYFNLDILTSSEIKFNLPPAFVEKKKENLLYFTFVKEKFILSEFSEYTNDKSFKDLTVIKN